MNNSEKKINTASCEFQINTVKEDDKYYCHGEEIDFIINIKNKKYKRIQDLNINNYDWHSTQYENGDFIIFDYFCTYKIYKVVNQTKTLYKVQEVVKIQEKFIEYYKGEHLHRTYKLIKFQSKNLKDEIVKIKKNECVTYKLDEDEINNNLFLESNINYYDE